MYTTVRCTTLVPLSIKVKFRKYLYLQKSAQCPSTTAVVKPVNDDNADEELSVIAEVE